jgi:protease II
MNPNCLHRWKTLKPPLAPKSVPHTITAHQISFEDEFHWLQNQDDPEVQQYIRKENDYFHGYFADPSVTARVDAIFKELVQLEESSNIQEVPELSHNYYYYQRFTPNSQFPMYCRKKSLHGPEEILLDINQEGSPSNYVSVRTPAFSVDQNLIGYAKSFTTDNFHVYTWISTHQQFVFIANWFNLGSDKRFTHKENNRQTLFSTFTCIYFR